jgi:type I restriction enzyme S subunit
MSNTANLSQWRKVSLSQIVTPRRGISYTADQIADRTSNCPLYINMKSFRKDASYNKDGEKFFADQFTEEDLLQANELLVVNTDVTPQGEILGVALRLPDRLRNTPTLFSHHVTALRHNDLVSKVFLYYLLSEDQTRRVIRSFGRGTTVKMLNFKEVLETEILLPTIQEQQKIAEILTSVDEVIENTQSQISKLEDLKKATMNELLTKGIGHTEFKETEVGKIPKSWEVFEIKNYLQSIKSGLSRNLSMSDIGLPVMNSGNIQNSTLERSQLKFWYEKDPQGSRTEDYYLNDGDLLLNFINSEKQIGKCCIYKQNGRREIFTTNLFRLRSNESTSPEFLHLLIINDRFQREMQIITKPAVNQASFTREEFLALKVPKVARDEQKLIVDASEKLIKYQFEVNKKLDCLLFIKRSLMQDLLTGKVRVTVN